MSWLSEFENPWAGKESDWFNVGFTRLYSGSEYGDFSLDGLSISCDVVNPKRFCSIRIGNYLRYNKFLLRDKNGRPLEYESGESSKGKIYLPQGTLITRLGTNKRNKNYHHVIAWYRGHYREGFVHSKAFEQEPSRFNPYWKDVFINDAEHVLSRVNKRLRKSNLKPESLLALKVSVERSIQLIRNGDISLTNRILLNVKKEYDRSFYLKDPVSIINEAENKIFSVFDPETDYGLFSDICLTVRLYPDWFLLDPSDGEMHEYYEKVWKNSNEGQLNRLIGASGEGVNMDMPESLELIKEELLNLKEKIKNKRKYKESNVGKWLSKLSSTSLAYKQLLVFIGEYSWKHGRKTVFAESIGLNNTFGFIRANPIHTILIHEYNVNFPEDGSSPIHSFFGEDSHIQEYDNTEVWQLACKGNFLSIAEDGKKLDNFWISNSYVSLVFLSSLLERIKVYQND